MQRSPTGVIPMEISNVSLASCLREEPLDQQKV